jgi:hypothetical protein
VAGVVPTALIPPDATDCAHTTEISYAPVATTGTATR